MKNALARSGLVYSTDVGRICLDCRQSSAACTCKQTQALQALPKTDNMVRVSRSTKGRGGKTVTLVTGLALDELALAQLAKQLKAACGSGGTVKNGVVEVQGDHCDMVISALLKQGHKAKRTGG